MMSLIKWEDGQGKLFTENYIVERIESNGVIKFIVNTYFPLTGNDCPNKHEICSTYEDAKMVVETSGPNS
jgi:hypothetical protein